MHFQGVHLTVSCILETGSRNTRKSCTGSCLPATATFTQFCSSGNFSFQAKGVFFPSVMNSNHLYPCSFVKPKPRSCPAVQGLLKPQEKAAWRLLWMLWTSFSRWGSALQLHSHGSWNESGLSATGRLGLCSVSSMCTCDRSHRCIELWFLLWRLFCMASHWCKEGNDGDGSGTEMHGGRSHLPFLCWKQRAVSILFMGQSKLPHQL